MSNVYILPRNFAATTEIPVAFQQGQRPIKMIKTGTVGGRILNERRTVRLQGMPSRSTNSTRRVLITPVVARQGQQNASRANYQFQPIAPATSELIPLQPAHLNGERTFSSFAPQQPIFIQENQQFSEEDNELDIGEVYKLLDESAGQRVNEFVNLPKRRERLTNLTLEQKMLRRKQKNRIAAQAARDRKKETNKRLEETLKRALQEIRRLRGELKFLQAQNSQLLAIKNGQNIEGKITQPQEHVFQPMPLFLPKQEILMSQAGHEQYFDSFQASAGRNKMKQNSQSSDKSSILSTNPSHQPVVVNTSLHQASPQSDNSSPLQQGSLGSAESFNDLLPWERESSPEVRVKETEKVMEKSKLMKRNKDKMPLMTIGQKAIRMACMIKVFTALWSIVCEKRETSKTNKSCNKSSTNFLKAREILFRTFVPTIHRNYLTVIEMDVPVDVDRFCNEVIEEGIAAENVVDGQRQTSTTVQESTASIGSKSINAHQFKVEIPFETGKYSEEFDFGTDEQQYLREQLFSFERGGTEQQHRVNRRGGLSNSSSAALAAALSPHNYCSQPIFNQQKYHKQQSTVTTQSQLLRHQQQKQQQHQSISNSDYISDNGLFGSLHEVPSPYKEEQYRQPHSIASTSSPFYTCPYDNIVDNSKDVSHFEDLNEEFIEENIESPLMPFCQNNYLMNAECENQNFSSSLDFHEQQQPQTTWIDSTSLNVQEEMFFQNNSENPCLSSNFPFLVDGLEDSDPCLL